MHSQNRILTSFDKEQMLVIVTDIAHRTNLMDRDTMKNHLRRARDERELSLLSTELQSIGSKSHPCPVLFDNLQVVC